MCLIINSNFCKPFFSFYLLPSHGNLDLFTIGTGLEKTFRMGNMLYFKSFCLFSDCDFIKSNLLVPFIKNNLYNFFFGHIFQKRMMFKFKLVLLLTFLSTTFSKFFKRSLLISNNLFWMCLGMKIFLIESLSSSLGRLLE